MMSLLSLASSICAGLRGGCATYAIAKINIRIRNELFSSLVKQEIGFFDTVKTGKNIPVLLQVFFTNVYA